MQLGAYQDCILGRQDCRANISADQAIREQFICRAARKKTIGLLDNCAPKL